jgi:parvulin-like peptidyl-prolyl isomerase
MSFLQTLRQEPLIHFALIGIAIFAADAWLTPANSDSVSSSGGITIEQSRLANWQHQFRRDNGRQPTDAEQQATITRWIDEEVLYREALRLGLHQNDAIVRRQLIQKMEFVIEGATPLPPATDQQLQTFIDNHPDRYNTPAKTSLQQVFYSRGSELHNSEAQINEQLTALQTAPESFRGLGDSFSLGQHVLNADEVFLRKHFGKQFVTAIRDLPAASSWQGPIESGLGLHLLRITNRIEAQPAKLADVRKKVALDYRLELEHQARRKALDGLQTRYHITISEPTTQDAP